MPSLSGAARDEIDEIVCELLDVEPFELTCASLLSRPGPDHEGPCVLGLLVTLECAFGVAIDPAELGPVTSLAGLYEVVADALARKRGRPSLAA